MTTTEAKVTGREDACGERGCIGGRRRWRRRWRMVDESAHLFRGGWMDYYKRGGDSRDPPAGKPERLGRRLECGGKRK